MPPRASPKKLQKPAAPCVLVADDEGDLIELLAEAMGKQYQHRPITAMSVHEARRVLRDQPIDLLVTDIAFPDGTGGELLDELRHHRPMAGAVVMTGSPSIEAAVSAMRQGAVDFLAKPFTVDEFFRRIDAALHRQAMANRDRFRVDRLRVALRNLHHARRLVTRKVDLLCNDLIGAYGDLARQFDQVRISDSFRAGAVHHAADLEQMLCHSMDWVLNRMGHCNMAVWLASEAGFQLGAYMKHTLPSDPAMIDAMRTGLVTRIQHDGLVRLTGETAASALTPAELSYLSGQVVMGSQCTYLDEALAQIVLFRESQRPFTDDEEATLRSICPIFALTLATLIRKHGPTEAGEEAGEDAEWWQRGEEKS